MSRKVDADFAHDGDGMGMNGSGGLRAGAFDVENVSGGGPQDALSHVTATRIAGTENENDGFHGANLLVAVFRRRNLAEMLRAEFPVYKKRSLKRGVGLS